MNAFIFDGVNDETIATEVVNDIRGKMFYVEDSNLLVVLDENGAPHAYRAVSHGHCARPVNDAIKSFVTKLLRLNSGTTGNSMVYKQAKWYASDYRNRKSVSMNVLQKIKLEVS